MEGYVRVLDERAQAFAKERGLLDDDGRPLHRHNQVAKCTIEEVVFYGAAGQCPQPADGPLGYGDVHSQVDVINAWMFKFRGGTQIIQSTGHKSQLQ